MIINHNISSMRSQGALFSNNRALGTDLHKLSTGLRINQASDDAAGLGISEGLRTQVRGQEQAKRNALDGISALNIVDGATNEIHSILQRMRELTVEGANATYTSTTRGYITTELGALSAEIDRIISTTKFNGTSLLTAGGGFQGAYLQVDANAETGVDTIEMDYSSYENNVAGASDLDVTGQQEWTDFIETIDTDIENLSTMRAEVGALTNRLESTVNNLNVSVVNQQAAESQIRELDFAYQSSQFTKNQILTQSATSMLTQANSTTQNVLSLIR